MQSNAPEGLIECALHCTYFRIRHSVFQLLSISSIVIRKSDLESGLLSQQFKHPVITNQIRKSRLE